MLNTHIFPSHIMSPTARQPVLQNWLSLHSSAGKESICNAGDSSSISELGRSAGKGLVYPLQYSWASLMAQMVKNPPPMQETWVPSLSWEDPIATHCIILAWRIPMDRGAWRATVLGVANSRRWLNDCAQHSIFMACTIFPGGSMVKNLPAMQKMRLWCLG